MASVEKLNGRVELSQHANRQDGDDSQRRSKLRAPVIWKIKLHDHTIKDPPSRSPADFENDCDAYLQIGAYEFQMELWLPA
jgi:hypothetical protein